MKLVDAIGRTHAPTRIGEEVRIVSLVPSLTELLCDLGLAPLLVGRTGFCVHPAHLLRDVPKVGGTKDVNLKRVRQLAPTHLIVNIDENRKEVAEALSSTVQHVIVTHPVAPCDNLALYQLFGGIFRAEAAAQRLAAAFEQAWSRLAALPKLGGRTVLYCIWKDPWMTISSDTYICRMLDLIGWQCWNGPEIEDSEARYPRFRWSAALAASVDAVLLSTQPYRFTQAHVDALETQIGKPVLLVNGELLCWYGSRAIAGLDYLRQLALDEPI